MLRVFISWSGTTSQKLAEGLRDWLPRVLQFVSPYVSTTDIERGSRWSYELARELENTSFGIFCVTKASVNEPWLNFEAGAISKSVESSRLVPLLFDLKPTDVAGPLVQFQMADCDKTSMKLLIRNLNAAAGDVALDEARLNDSFDMWWSKFNEIVKHIREADQTADDAQPKAEDEKTRMLEEILLRVRNQQRIDSDLVHVAPGAIADLSVRWEHFAQALGASGALSDPMLEDAFSRLRQPISFITSSGSAVRKQWASREAPRNIESSVEAQLEGRRRAAGRTSIVFGDPSRSQ